MTTPAPTLRPPAMSPDIPTLPIYRLSVDQYFGLVGSGILSEEDRVELIDGWIVTKLTKYPPHVIATDCLSDLLRRLAPDGWFVRTESPIVVGGSVPEPDIALIRGRSRDYGTHHPNVGQIALIAEVAESSLPRDRGEKLGVYAKGGVTLYWLVNLIDMVVEVYSEPTTSAGVSTFAHATIYRPGDSIPVALDGVEVGQVAVSEILP